MRYVLLVVLLFTAGCGVTAAIGKESPDTKAIREWLREERGDGFKVEITNVRKAGSPSDYLAKFAGDTDWKPIDETGRCAIAHIAMPSTPLASKGDSLFVIDKDKVVAQYGMFKRAN